MSEVRIREGHPRGTNSVRRDVGERVGTTTGINQNHCEYDYSAEQVYVNVNPEVPSHPIYIEGWCGYAVVSRLRLSKRQATELIGLLAAAVGMVP